MKAGFIAIGGAILALFLTFEILIDIPVVWWLYLGISVVLLSGLLLPGGSDRDRSRFQNAALVVTAVAAWAVYLYPWTSRKPFLKDLGRVEIGMTESEVREIMAGYMTGTGWKLPPQAAAEADSNPGQGGLVEVSSGARMETGSSDDGELTLKGSIVFRHSDEWYYNSDWGVVSFEDGRVVGKRFMPD